MTQNTPADQPPLTPQDAKARAAAEKAYKKSLRPWYKKKRFIIPIVVVALIAITQMGGGGNDTPTATDTSVTDMTTTAATENAAPETAAAEAPAEWTPPFPGALEDDIIGSPGQALDMDGVLVTVSGLTYREDAIGGEYLIASITIQNNSDKTISYNAYEFNLQNPGGSVESPTFGGTDSYLGTGEIVPGGSASGELPWDAKNGDETGQFIVLYEPMSVWSSDRAAWVVAR